MICYEFYLKPQYKSDLPFSELCEIFYSAGNVPAGKRWDNPKDETGKPIEASAVYAVSRNPKTGWVQILVDDNAPTSVLNTIEARIRQLCDTAFAKSKHQQHHIAPKEKTRREAMI